MRLSTSRFPLYLLFICLTTASLNAQNESSDPAGAVVLDGHKQRHVITAKSAQQVLQIESLIPGQTYSLIVPQDLALGACQPDIQALSPYSKVSAFDKIARELIFEAEASTMHFQLNYACDWSADNPPRHAVSIVCKSCLKKDLKAYKESMAVLEVQGGASADELVKDVLIGGNCFDITNVTFSGNGGQIGRFSNGLTNIGFASGVIMATGDVSVAPGPNDQDGASAGYGTSTPDSDLATLTGGALFDMANIEFDFTPTQSPLTFNFAFASEEYCEYVGSQYNDVFGFFISGPGIPGGQQNIALIPATMIPVAINNVNHLTNTGYYVNNQPSSSNNLCGQNPSFGPAVNELQYDGFTRKFTAIANVQPCATYHIKLKIADVGDGVWDSAVFLNSGSFDAGGNASVEWVVDDNPDDKDVFEGCGTVKLVFRRIGNNLSVPLPVQFTVTGTATAGLDYSNIPPVIVIPVGQSEYVLNVNILNDLILEGSETVIITLNNPCSCLNPQETLTIEDLPVLDILADTVVICGSGAGTVNVEVLSGVEPYTYQWQNGSNEPSATLFVGTSTNVRVTVTDACGKTKVATARIIVQPLPRAQLLPPAPQICEAGQDALLKVSFIGMGPFTLEYMLNGDPQPIIDNITDNPYFITVNQPGLYQIISVTDSAGCQGPGQGALLVLESTLALTGVASNVQCASANNGTINTTVTGGQGPYNYTWTGPVNITNIPDPINLPAGTYNVTVTDGFGCTDTQTFSIIAPNALTPTIASVQGTNCANPSIGSINLEVSGGFPAYTYLWSNASNVQDPSGLTAGTYTVTVTDQSGCTAKRQVDVPGDFTPPVATAAVTGILTCQVTTLTLSGSGSSSGPNFKYKWTAAPGNIVSGDSTLNPVVNQAGNYILQVTNSVNGCKSLDTVAVQANTTLPTAEAGPAQTITCAITNATLDGAGSSAGPSFTYLWTAGGGGIIVSGASTLNPVVSTAGTYTLMVTNTQTGCTQTDVVTVGLNNTPPTAAIAPPGTLTCTVSQVTLNGSATPTGGSYAYQWSTVNGNVQSGQASANAVVTEEGNYTLVVTNTANGCTDDATVFVDLDFTDPAAVVIVNDQLTCTNKTVTIDATASSNGPGYSFFWSTSGGGNIQSGSNTLTPIANTPGFYSIIVTNLANNCTASASVQITQNIIPPIVNPGTPGTLNCTTTQIQLGDPATVVLPHITYQWTFTSGGNILSGANTPSIMLNQPATYTLLVTNTQNGCTSSGSTLISQNIIPPNAVVGTPGQINCVTPTLQLSGAGSSSGANMKYQWTANPGNIAAGATTLTPTINSAGTYTLVVTNQTNGCTTSASTTVTASLTPPTVTVAQPNLITCFQPQQTLSGIGSSSGSNFQYQWGTQNGQILSGANSLQPVVGAAGTYNLLVTNTSNSCTSSASVTVDSDVIPPVSNAGQQQTLNCTNTSLSLDGSGSSQGANFTYQWSAINGGNLIPPTNIINPAVDEPGTYQLIVTNTTNGCTSASSVQIQEDDTDPVVLIAAPGILNCINGQIPLNGAGSSSGNNISYAWTGPGIVSGNTSLNATVNQPGTYTLQITNTNNGCSSEKTVTVAQDIQAPTAAAGADNILNCYQPQLQLGDAGSSTGPDFTYSWTGLGIVSGGNTPAPIVDQPGLYTIVITNTVNGCTATDNVNLTIDQTPPQAVGGPGFQLTCTQTSYTMNPTVSQGANFAYNWETNTGNFLSATNILNPEINGAGFYFLTVTNTTNGCTATDQVQITQSADFPNADAGTANILTCVVNSLTLNGANSSTGSEFSYMWTTLNGGNIVSGNTALNPVIDQPGTYQLAVTNNNNSCVSYSSVVVNQNITLPTVEAGNPQTLTCTLAAITLQGQVGTNGNFLYNWQTADGTIVNGANTLSPSVSAVGTYLLTVTNTINGCVAADSVAVLVDQNAPAIVVEEPTMLTCQVKQVTLNATGTSTGNVQYDWTSNGGSFSNLNDPLQPIVDQPGTYTLTVTNLDNGCTTSSDIVVEQDIVNPTAEAGAIQTLTCALTTLTLSGNGSSQNGPYFYEWTTPNGSILAGNNSLTPTIAAPGTYALLVQNTINGCSSTDQVQVNQDIQEPTVVIAAAPELTCAVAQVTLNGNGSSTGTNFSYAWTTANGNVVGGASNIQAQVNTPGMYTLNVLNNVNGCSNAMDVQVTSNTVAPDVEAGPPFTLTCTIDKVTLQAFASNGQQFSYAWSTTGGNILSGVNSLMPQVNKDGIYTLLVTNNINGCTKTDNVEIFLEKNIPTDFAFDLKRPSCLDNDGKITFMQVTGGYGPYLYSIDNGQSFNTTIDYEAITPGSYDLWIQDANGCEFHKTLVVPKALDPSISIAPEFNIELGDSLVLEAVLPSGYSLALIDSVIWTPLDGLTFNGTGVLDLLRPTAKPVKPTEYTVTIVSKDGCRASDRVLVRVDNEPHIYIPNAFSPWDEDGENDEIFIFADGDQVLRVRSFQIFDRWGTMVFRDTNFQPNDRKHGWDGFHHGKMMTPAVFVYYAEIDLIDGRTLLYKGDITLVR